MAASGRDLQMRELMDTMKELKLTIEALRKELTARDKLIDNQQEQIAYLQKKLFGTSSEKRSLVVEGQLGLFDEAETEAAKDDPESDTEADTEADAEAEVVTFTKSRSPKTTKEELLKGVPVKEKVISLPEAERICQECGTELKPCGKKYIRDEWNFQPARLTVTRIYAETYYCPECKKEAGRKDSDTGNNIVTAKVSDALIPHSMASAPLVGHAIYQKYANAVPLYRQEKDWAQYGALLSRSRLARWINFCSDEYFVPIYDYLHRLLLQRDFLMADETRIQVLKEPGREPETDSFMVSAS